MLWDVDYDSTDTMMKDVGVSLLMPDGKKTNGRHSVKSQSNATQPAQSHVSSSSLCSEKNTHSCFLQYLHGKCSHVYKILGNV